MQKTLSEFMEDEGREVAEKILAFLESQSDDTIATAGFFREAATAFRECADGLEGLAAKLGEGE